MTTNGNKDTNVTGYAEIGSSVNVYVKNNNNGTAGALIGTATADQAGNFTIKTNPAQNNNTFLLVSATDKAGNTSQFAQVTTNK
ncbi:hypothetical protein IEC97_11210 [Neobacillus cucumis]|nr:hypothetical protein [Neobacillus cucumis]